MRIVVGVLVVLAVMAGAAGILSYTYHAGVAEGLAHGPAPAVPGSPGGVAPYPMGPYGYGWHGPFGVAPFGFGFFGLLWPIVWIVLLVALFRAAFWRGRGPWMRGPGCAGHPGGGSGGVPAWLEEWHRRTHEAKAETGTV